MNNIKLPAYPLPLTSNGEGEIKDASDWEGSNTGFSKLELASLMIAQGYAANSLGSDQGIQPPALLQPHEIADRAVALAKAVLEEANK